MVTTTGSPTGPGARWGPVGDDPVGTASARLLATGVARRDRLDALSLLGLLGDHADHDGLVRLPLSTLAGEFSMPEARARRLLGALVEVGAVALRPDGLAVVGWEPSAAGGLRLAGFLANVAIVFDEDDLDDDVLVVDDLPPARRPVVAAGGAPRRRREPVLVAVITMAAALLATLTPSSGPPTALRTITSSPLATVLAEGGPTTTGMADARSEDEPSPSRYSPGTPAPPSPVPGVTPTDDQVSPESAVVGPAYAVPDGAAAVPVSPGPAGDDGVATRVPPPPRLTVRRPPSSPAPSGGVQVPPEPTASPSPQPVAPDPMVCPVVETPYAVVDSVVVGASPVEGLAGLAGPAFVEVTGTVVNPGAVDVVVGLLEIGIDLGHGRVVLPGSPSPLTVPAEAQGAWRMTSTVPAGSAGAERDDVDARVLRWWWLDGTVPEACPR